MDWMQQIDGYCERLDGAYWAEPVNALTNAAFVLAALVVWRQVLRQRGAVGLAPVLVALLVAIGIGSFLFHTHGRAWAALADVAPILLFVLVYIFAINRDVWGLSRWRALALAALFFPYAALAVPVFQLVPGLGGSAVYAPVVLLIALYALALWRREGQTAVGLAIGAGILAVSIAFRALDLPLCSGWPLGTHFMWHLLNALMLGWMIDLYLRHLRRTSEAAAMDATRHSR